MPAGQPQKEFYYNEAITLADILLHAAVEGEANDPPAAPVEGECWIVGTQPTGEWADNAGDLASFQNGQWVYAAPRDGLRVRDTSAGYERRYDQGWQVPSSVESPAGGTTIDTEARAAITALIDALVAAGIFTAA